MSTALERKWFGAIAELAECQLCHTLRGPFQVAHRDFNKGMGQKTSPFECTLLCLACHQELTDGTLHDRPTKRAMMDRAIVNAHRRLGLAGQLRIV